MSEFKDDKRMNALKSEVERLKVELKEAQTACEEWKGKLIKSAFDVSKLKADLREGNIPLESKLDQTLKERDEAQAAAAVMRGGDFSHKQFISRHNSSYRLRGNT